jgi:hypothetical protein
MTAPPGLNFDNVFEITLQVAIVLFVFHLIRKDAVLSFVVAELLCLVFLSLQD